MEKQRHDKIKELIDNVSKRIPGCFDKQTKDFASGTTKENASELVLIVVGAKKDEINIDENVEKMITEYLEGQNCSIDHVKKQIDEFRIMEDFHIKTNY